MSRDTSSGGFTDSLDWIDAYFMSTVTVSEWFCGDFLVLPKHNKAHLYVVAQTGILNSFSELILTFFVTVKAAATYKLFFSWETYVMCSNHTYVVNVTYPK